MVLSLRKCCREIGMKLDSMKSAVLSVPREATLSKLEVFVYPLILY